MVFAPSGTAYEQDAGRSCPTAADRAGLRTSETVEA